MTKNRITSEILEGLGEILEHKKGKVHLKGRLKELPEPAPHFSVREIKKLRKEVFHMSQTEFAALLNVKVATIRAWEQGHNTPSGAAARLLELFEEDPSMVERLIA